MLVLNTPLLKLNYLISLKKSSPRLRPPCQINPLQQTLKQADPKLGDMTPEELPGAMQPKERTLAVAKKAAPKMGAPKLPAPVPPLSVPNRITDKVSTPIVWAPLIPVLGERYDKYNVELSRAFHIITRHKSRLRDAIGLVTEYVARRMIKLDDEYNPMFELSTFGMTTGDAHRGHIDGKHRYGSATCSHTGK